MSETAATGDDDTLTFNLTLTAAPSSPRVPVTVSKKATASQLRAQAAQATKIPLTSLKLIFRGRLIGNDDAKEVVTEFKLENDCVIHCMGKPASSAAAVPMTSSVASMPTSAGSSVSVPPVAAVPGSSPSVASGDPLQAALAALRSSNTSAVYLTAVQTLEKVLLNVTSHPMEEKYRRVKKQNAAFQRRLGGLTGGDAAMKAVGFTVEMVDGEECYLMVPSADAWPKLVACKAAVTQAVAEATRATASGTAPLFPPPASMPGAGAGMGGPGFGNVPVAGMGGPGFGNVPPGMESAVANMMSNPQALQGMLQNPRVRQMMESDPRFANNPMLRQTLDSFANNPEQLNQLSQMMQDPNMQRQMQAMMSSGQMPPGMGGFGGTTRPASTSNNNAGTPSANTGTASQGGTTGQAGTARSDEEMTEEEMLAEAIARSMRET